MDKARLILEQFKNELQTASPQQYDNLLILPVMAPAYDEPVYITADEAFQKGCLSIVEVSESGSVPYLKAINKCGNKIFLPEGEEIKGAKQNRTFNTSILLPEYSETIIPVSCTEQGRWHYKDKEFTPTDSWVPSDLRRRKVKSVSDSLNIRQDFRSDQAGVWNDIVNYSRKFNSHSSTNALRDSLESQKKTVDKMVNFFTLQKGQTGIVVFINGKLKGVDIITNPEVFARLYPKILKSYLFDAVKSGKKNTREDFFDLQPEYRYNPDDVRQKFAHLLEVAFTGNHFINRSPGLGFDIRMESPQVNGFALAYEEKVIHLALFRNSMDRRDKWIRV